MHRYFVKLSYKGTHFHGWQIQPNALTVQEVLQKAFSLLLKEDIAITGAGRTDAGVHAVNYTAHFETSEPVNNIPDLIYKLNSFLSSDIAIHEIFPVKEDVHARFSALSRTYEYRIHQKKNPFLRETSLYVYEKLDFTAMNSVAKILFEYNDFTSFSKLHTDTKTNLCKIIRAEWIDRNEQKVFIIEADRFLRNMVRAITGTLLDVGRGKINENDFRKIIESKNRSSAGASAPAHALFLTEIKYPEFY